MASLPIRDPIGDHLLTPQNAALVVIDYQPSQFAAVGSIDHDLLLENIVSTVQTAKAFDMPIVHSTIVYPVVDAIGGTSEEAHRTGLQRVVQAGAQPVTWVALAVELQRDWAREETVADVIEIVLTERLLKA